MYACVFICIITHIAVAFHRHSVHPAQLLWHLTDKCLCDETSDRAAGQLLGSSFSFGSPPDYFRPFFLPLSFSSPSDNIFICALILYVVKMWLYNN